jgi:TrwC relaxase
VAPFGSTVDLSTADFDRVAQRTFRRPRLGGFVELLIYYSGEGEAEGYWLGDAARDLGLEGKVDADQLVAMLTGRNPVTGEPLGLKTAPGREPVPGFDRDRQS